MIKIYGMITCPDCSYLLDQISGLEDKYEYIEKTLDYIWNNNILKEDGMFVISDIILKKELPLEWKNSQQMHCT